ncbi:MAG: YggS family pyridoxal phosphate-dependent enzyme [Thiotrichales bacterium]|nr:MAG: YggS family pyridoxal phosphate-dependent enzyme [Thiotrichales bacterium]
MPSSSIRDNLVAVKQQISEAAVQAGRAPEEIQLIAVSKTRSLDEVKSAIDAGQLDFGENTMQDALSKIPELRQYDPRWHFIGHLQSKKARQIPGNFHWVHSVDSLKLAQKLSNAMVNAGEAGSINCLVQVNVSAEESKSGLNKSEVLFFMDELLQLELPHINWRGLMTIGVQGDDDQTRAAFAELRRMLHQCQNEFGQAEFDQLSMGMSHDYPIAIEEGSTMVRVGTAIFGARQAR